MLENRIVNIVNKFDKNNQCVSKYNILDEINALNIKFCDLDDEEKYEVIGFILTENYEDKDDGWGIYWGPERVLVNEDGKRLDIPSLELITDKCLDYWKKRVEEVKNPILASRYCNLVIEFMKLKNQDKDIYEFCKKVIDYDIIIYENKLYKYDRYTRFSLERTFNLAKKINDNDNIEKIKNIIIDFDENVDDNKPGIWGLAFELFILKNKKDTDAEDKSRIITILESRLSRVIEIEDIELINEFSVEKVCENLATYYKNVNKKEESLRVLNKLREFYKRKSYIQIPIQIQNNLEKIYKLYKQFGYKEEAYKILSEIREMGKSVVEDMQCISDTIQIPKEEIDKFLEALLNGSLEKSINRIVGCYIPSKSKIVDCLREEVKEFPLQNLFGKKVVNEEGRVICNIGSINEDLEGNVIFKMYQNMQIDKIIMGICLDKLIEIYDLSSEKIIVLLRKTPIIIEEREKIIKVGIDAYLHKDYITSINILIPQIEYIFRSIIELQGGNVLKVNRQGMYQLITLDQVLRDKYLVDLFSADIMLYLRVLFTDPRGWNIRNNVCHGLIAEKYYTKGIADRVMHVIFLLCQVTNKSE